MVAVYGQCEKFLSFWIPDLKLLIRWCIQVTTNRYGLGAELFNPLNDEPNSLTGLHKIIHDDVSFDVPAALNYTPTVSLTRIPDKYQFFVKGYGYRWRD